jgi:two-component system, chemotaxis family, chemotaxis protein CheY
MAVDRTTRELTPIAAADRSRLRIIYAEDLEELRDLLEIVLTREGHAVESVSDGSAALERIRAQPDAYDLLVTDHHMPLLNGVQLIEGVRATPFSGKIIVFSSEVNPAVHEQYRQLGVDRIVDKPVFPSTLRSTLAELFPPVSA